MDKKEVVVLAQLLHALSDIADRMEKSFKMKNAEELAGLKREAVSIQGQIAKIL